MTAPILALALILDALFGEPDWLWRRLPHPAALMGRLIAALDRRFNHPPPQAAMAPSWPLPSRPSPPPLAG